MSSANTSTPLGKEELKKVNAVLQNLFDNGESAEFRLPVDADALGLVDYYTIIKNPMDLGTVRKNLKANKYKTVEEIVRDIELIWDNCKTYNAEGSWIWKQADKLDKYTRKLIRIHLPTIQVRKGKDQESGGEEDDEIITHQEKLKLAQKVKNLTQDQLGVVVKMVQDECPVAWKEIEKDKYQILVDSLRKDIFEKIDDYIDSCVDQQSKKVKS